jgi:hypothetical protein
VIYDFIALNNFAVPTTGDVDNNLPNFESLVNILYPSDEREVDPDDQESRSKRAAVMEDDVLPGSNIERLRQLSRLLRKCCTSCTVEDIVAVCPRRPRTS